MLRLSRAPDHLCGSRPRALAPASGPPDPVHGKETLQNPEGRVDHFGFDFGKSLEVGPEMRNLVGVVRFDHFAMRLADGVKAGGLVEVEHCEGFFHFGREFVAGTLKRSGTLRRGRAVCRDDQKDGSWSACTQASVIRSAVRAPINRSVEPEPNAQLHSAFDASERNGGAVLQASVTTGEVPQQFSYRHPLGVAATSHQPILVNLTLF